ncbi:MAG TPA: hypothetical protein VGM43_08745 [Bryobacteraceae bacterium]|jgi:hypothetical protein
MTTAVTHVDERVGSSASTTPTAQEVGAQLRCILSSPAFHGSKRCQQFLEYVCRKALSGESGALKEKILAIEVFGRRPDTAGHGEDTIVRVGAREVRKRLAQFYVSPEGVRSPVVIDLASGAYVPDFHYAVPRPDTVATTPEPVELKPPSPAKRWSRRLLIIASSALVILTAGLILAHRSATGTSDTEFEKFWAPVFQAADPLLIGVGHPIVYMPSRRISRLNAQLFPPSDLPQQQKIELPPSQLTGSDMVPVLNQYVGFGDMVASEEVSQMLARRSRRVRLMLASSIPFADLRSSQVYLIGSFSNQWTVELSQNWRFRFKWTADHHPVFFDTQQNPSREWTIPAEDNGSTPEDYSLICRIRNSPTGGLVIVSAGIKQFGTEAAGRFLADPAALETTLHKLPRGWENKNLQIILHTHVIGNTPAQPELVAWHVW